MQETDPKVETPLSGIPIVLWYTCFDQIGDETLLARYRSLLNKSELEQETRFHFERDQRRYLITRALVRTVLSQYAPVAATDWTFRNNDYGRPEASNQEAREQQLTFNISHTNHLIVVAVTRDRMLGVDTENYRQRQTPLNLADRYFAAEEVAALYGLPEKYREQRFYELWTLKESYIKARGLGLSIPLASFSFHLPESGQIDLSVKPEQNDSSDYWRFWQFQLAQDYLVAVCVQRTESPEQPPLFVNVLPLVSAQAATAKLLRQSR